MAADRRFSTANGPGSIEVSQDSRLLAVLAHPDDETFRWAGRWPGWPGGVYTFGCCAPRGVKPARAATRRYAGQTNWGRFVRLSYVAPAPPWASSRPACWVIGMELCSRWMRTRLSHKSCGPCESYAPRRCSPGRPMASPATQTTSPSAVGRIKPSGRPPTLRPT